MPRTRVKICGVRDHETAMAAIEAGADAVGFVFARKSPRSIEPEDAWDIVSRLPPMATTVGLFVDASPEEYREYEGVCPTDYGQLHGQEDEDTARECGPRIVKAVRFDGATIERELARWAAVDEVDAILVDGSAGGEGVTCDWPALARVKETAAPKPLILAGGLDASNVGEAIRIVRPYAVDVSSGVETPGHPGQKDPARIREFLAAVQRADASQGV